jgi:hypothetical protein
VSLKQDGIANSSVEDFTVNIQSGKSTFKVFHQLGSKGVF